MKIDAEQTKSIPLAIEVAFLPKRSVIADLAAQVVDKASTSQRDLGTAASLIKYQLADAVEPSEEVRLKNHRNISSLSLRRASTSEFDPGSLGHEQYVLDVKLRNGESVSLELGRNRSRHHTPDPLVVVTPSGLEARSYYSSTSRRSSQNYFALNQIKSDGGIKKDDNYNPAGVGGRSGWIKEQLKAGNLVLVAKNGMLSLSSEQ